MTAPYRKKLIEVSLPLAAINAESAREKSIRHGHPSTLHLWWARRPLAACRAVLFSSLVDDPDSDPQYRKPDGSVDEDRAGIKRADLFNLIEELVAWENSNNTDIIRSARAEIARCVASRKIELKELDPKLELAPKVTVYDLVTRGHCRPKAMGLDKKAGRVRFAFDISQLPPADVVNKFLAEHAPPVLDPFAGGGSIPLEAQRLGLRAYASDLNPVPVLINKALIEIPPKFAGRPPVNPESRGEGSGKSKGKKKLIEHDWPGATGLADDVRYYGKWMRDEAEKRVGHLYPKVKLTSEMAKDRPDLKEYVGEELTVIAWLWSRTVTCSNPACAMPVPLARAFWLSTKPKRKAWIELKPDHKKGRVGFVVRTNEGAPPKGTVDRRGAKCPFCSTAIAFDVIRDEGVAHRITNSLMAIVCEGRNGQVYLSPTLEHVQAANQPKPARVPESNLPTRALGFRVQRYGLNKYADLFSNRQLEILDNLTTLVNETTNKVTADCRGCSRDYILAIKTYLALTVSKFSNRCSTLTFWDSGFTKVQQTFARQALSMIWDWVEVNPFSDSSGCFTGQLGNVVENIEHHSLVTQSGYASQLDAAESLPEIADGLFSTDPPYYDNINYAELSDYFYTWLRLCLRNDYPSLFSTVATPKRQQLVAEPGMFDGEMSRAVEHFENGLLAVFRKMRASAQEEFPLTVFYAFKQQEQDENEESTDSQTVSTGWEKMLEAILISGFAIDGTWPLRTEQAGGLRVLGRNALASSIVLVCRPRPNNATAASRKEFITELRNSLPEALRDLQQGNIAPVDLAQSAIGPGMAVLTRYSKVMETDGSAMTVRTALGLINQVLDEVLAEQEGDFDSDTRWALAWFEQFGMKEEAFGVAETLSKAKNTAVNGLVEAGVIVAKSGKVRLLKRDELPDDWDPATDRRLTVWESVQHLIRVLETKGEVAAGDLVKTLGSQAETCRDLAYRLYSICERKKWAEEALAYNGLVIAWPELVRLSLASDSRPRETQAQLFS